MSLVKILTQVLGQAAKPVMRSADDLARQVMPAVMNTGDSVLIERTTNALRNMGARVPSQPGPGLLGTTEVKTMRQLGAAPKPAFGPGSTAVAPPGGAPAPRGLPRGVTTSTPVQGPSPAPLRAPEPGVRYPGPAPATETARQITMLKPGANEVGSMGTRLTYAPGTQGLTGRLGSTTYGEGTEIGAASLYPRAQQSLAESLESGFTLRPEAPGTPLFRTQGIDQYVAPKPAWGGGEVLEPELADVVFKNGEVLDPSVMDLLFGGARGGVPGGAAVKQGGRGGALARSPGGQVVDELMIDPDRVREIFEKSPELVSALGNAAGGVQFADLGALLSNPMTRAAIGLAGIGALGTGIAGMGAGGEKPEPFAGDGVPVYPPTTTPLFTEDGSTPLGEGAPAIAPPNPPARGNIDPTAAAPVVTGGGLERESSVREALAQAAPQAAAVQRATEPMSPERYKSIEDYYAARAAYAGSADKRRELMKYMEGQSQNLGPQLAAWAQQNPTLAYEYQRRQLANPAANQQSAESITTTTVTTPMGSETPANAVGNAQATAQAATAPSQGAFELVDATRPQVQSNLQRVQEFIQRQAPRSSMYAGY